MEVDFIKDAHKCKLKGRKVCYSTSVVETRNGTCMQSINYIELDNKKKNHVVTIV